MNIFSLNRQLALKESLTNRQVLYFPNDTKTIVVNGVEYNKGEVFTAEEKEKLELLLVANITISEEESKVTVSYVDGSEKSFYSSPKIVSTTYGEPVVTITCNDVPREGGKIYPNVSYTLLKTVTYADGTVEETYVTAGAEITYEGAEEDGSIVVPSATATQRTKVKTVTVNVTINGQTTSKTIDIYQWGEIPKPDEGTIYYGLIPQNIMPDDLSQVIIEHISLLDSINTVDIPHELYRLLEEGKTLPAGHCYIIIIPSHCSEKAQVWNGISGFVDFDVPDGKDSNLYFWGNRTLEYNGEIYRIYGLNLISTGITNYGLIEM